MQSDRTPTGRVVDFSQVTTGRGGQCMARSEMLGFIRGIRGPRQEPVSFKQISRWLCATPDDFIHKVLDDLLAAGIVRIIRTSLNRKRAGYRYEINSNTRCLT